LFIAYCHHFLFTVTLRITAFLILLYLILAWKVRNCRFDW